MAETEIKKRKTRTNRFNYEDAIIPRRRSKLDIQARKQEPTILSHPENMESAVFRKAHREQLKKRGPGGKGPRRKAQSIFGDKYRKNTEDYERGDVDKETYRAINERIEREEKGFGVVSGAVIRKKKKKYKAIAEEVKKIKIPSSAQATDEMFNPKNPKFKEK